MKQYNCPTKGCIEKLTKIVNESGTQYKCPGGCGKTFDRKNKRFNEVR